MATPAEHFSKDARTPWEIEAADREAREQHASQSRTPKAAFLLGMMVATIGLLTVQHYGLGDASLTKFFFSPVVPQVQPVSGAIGRLTPPKGPQMNAAWDGEKDIYDFEKQKEFFLRWDPNSPRTYTNFNPFERNLDGGLADYNGCFPGESRGYKSPNRPNVNWETMQAEKVKMEELKKHPNFGLKGCPGCWSLKWQENLGNPP